MESNKEKISKLQRRLYQLKQEHADLNQRIDDGEIDSALRTERRRLKLCITTFGGYVEKARAADRQGKEMPELNQAEALCNELAIKSLRLTGGLPNAKTPLKLSLVRPLKDDVPPPKPPSVLLEQMG